MLFVYESLLYGKSENGQGVIIPYYVTVEYFATILPEIRLGDRRD